MPIHSIKNDEKIFFHSHFSGMTIFKSVRRCIFEAERITRCRLKERPNIAIPSKKNLNYLKDIGLQYETSCLSHLRKFTGNIHTEEAYVFVVKFCKSLPEHATYTGSQNKVFRAIFYIIHKQTANLICKMDTEQCFSDTLIDRSEKYIIINKG